jgi:hypothetical protein
MDEWGDVANGYEMAIGCTCSEVWAQSIGDRRFVESRLQGRMYYCTNVNISSGVANFYKSFWPRMIFWEA